VEIPQGEGYGKGQRAESPSEIAKGPKWNMLLISRDRRGKHSPKGIGGWRENGDGRKKAELLTTLPLILGNWRIADTKAPKGM